MSAPQIDTAEPRVPIVGDRIILTQGGYDMAIATVIESGSYGYGPLGLTDDGRRLHLGLLGENWHPHSPLSEWLASDARISAQHDRDEAEALRAGNVRLVNLIGLRRRQWKEALAERVAGGD